MKTVTQEYLMGIKEGREMFTQHGMSIATAELENIESTMKGFPANTPVGQMLRGERDFWKNQIRIAK